MKKKLSIILASLLLLLVVAGCGTNEPTTYDVNVKVLVDSADGNGLSNVILKDSDGNKLATTNDSGLATIKDQTGEITITPNHSDYTFEPENTVTNKAETVEFIATKKASNNTNLKSITLSEGTLDPSFSSDVTTYNVSLPFGTSKAPTVTASAMDENATVKITDATALPGKTTIEVTAEDGTTTKTYTINFNLPSETSETNANLSSISSDDKNFTLEPAFSADVLDYEVNISDFISDLPTVTATPAHEDATVKVTQADSTNQTTTIKVTAADGTTTKTYTVTYNLAPHSTLMTLSNVGILLNIPDQEFDLRAFDVTVSGESQILSDVSIMSSSSEYYHIISFPLNVAIKAGEEIKFTYSPTGTNDLTKIDGSPLDPITDLLVNNPIPSFTTTTNDTNEFIIEFSKFVEHPQVIDDPYTDSIYEPKVHTFEDGNNNVIVKIDSSINPASGDKMEIEVRTYDMLELTYEATFSYGEWTLERI